MNESQYALLKKCFSNCTVQNSDHERQPQKNFFFVILQNEYFVSYLKEHCVV